MKIAHLIATNFFGGPEKQIIEHALRVNRSKFDLSLISFKEGFLSNDFIIRAKKINLKTLEIESRNPFNPMIIFRLATILKKENINLLFVHGYKANIIGRISGWLIGIPVVAVSRGWTGENLKIKTYELLDKLFLRLAEHIVAVSEGQKKKIVKLGIPEDKVSVVHNSININTDTQNKINISPIKKEMNLSDRTKVIISVGRLSPEKNFQGLIEVAEIILKKRDDVVFIVYGEGFLRKELEKKIREKGRENRIFLMGFKNNIISLLQETDIFVLPSLTEGLPNVVLEAYAVKKPVVATAVGGVPELVRHGVNGFMVGPQEREKMAEYINTLLDNSRLREEMGDRGYQYVKRHFNFELQTQKLEYLYRKTYETFYQCNYAR